MTQLHTPYTCFLKACGYDVGNLLTEDDVFLEIKTDTSLLLRWNNFKAYFEYELNSSYPIAVHTICKMFMKEQGVGSESKTQ